MLSHSCLAALLLGLVAADNFGLAAKCGTVAGCLDTPDEASLHLLQQHALHLQSSEHQSRATVKARSPTRPAPVKAAAADATASPRAEAAFSQALAGVEVASMTSAAPTTPAEVVATTTPSVRRDATVSKAPRTKPDVKINEEVAEVIGLSANAAGDLTAFTSSLVTNLVTIVACAVMFSFLRVRYPLVYSGNVVKDGCTAPSRPDPKSLFSWVGATAHGNTEVWIDCIGLDNTMLLEFSHLCMRISLVIGGPLICILAPLHYFYGGNAAGPDHMSLLSMGNIEYFSWLYWVHPVFVWYVILVVIHYIFAAQRDFVHWRFAWMKRIPEKCANTVLVTGISTKRQSDSELKEFFEKMFPGSGRIKSAYVVKDTGKLPKLVTEWKGRKDQLHQAEKKEEGMVATLSFPISLAGSPDQAAQHYRERMAALWKMIEQQRNEIMETSIVCGKEGHNTTNGFVTFTNRADAEIALRLDAISKDQAKWDIQRPPEPNDIIWNELTEDPTAVKGEALMGYALLAGLFIAYIPIIIALTHIAKAVELGPLQPFWEGLAPTFGLQFMIAFLPTFLILIFRFFFLLKAEAFAQQRLQIWYFWFQVFFVILVTAVGRHVTDFFAALIQSPLAIFRFFGETMPEATHFYMNFLVLQWTAHVMNMLRYVNLFKYISFRSLYTEAEAAAKAEPEDQDFYGIGSRSARWSINMIIGIVFSTLCPPIIIMVFVNFVFCRVVYGYLIPYAETKKPDTGGHLWVSTLRHIFVGLMIYVILMTGVLYSRANSSIPSWITASSFLYIAWSFHRFDEHFNWQMLPFKYVVDEETRSDMKAPKRELGGEYRQPELFEDYEDIKAFMEESGIQASGESS